MEEFRSYLPEAVISENLSETLQRLAAIVEQEQAHLSDLASEILTDGKQITELINSLPDRMPPDTRFNGTSLSENAVAIKQFCRSHAVWRTVRLCATLCRKLGIGQRDAPSVCFSENEELSPTARNRIIYQRTSYTNQAYQCFQTLTSAPIPLYTHHFNVACEEVARGNCEYCILPMESAPEGSRHVFSRLLNRFDLKIAAVCDIPVAEGDRTTRCALLRKNMLPLSVPIDQNTVFECIIPPTCDLSVTDFLLAAEYCGLELLRIEMCNLEDPQETPTVTHLTFSVADGDLSAYLFYLAMQAPDYEPLGIYNLIH